MISQVLAESASSAGDGFGSAGTELLFEAHPAPMFIYAPETLEILAVNRAAVLQYGYGRAEFLALNLRDLRPTEDVAQLERIVRSLRGPSASGIFRHRRKDGSLIIVSIYSSPIRFDNRDARLVVATDVTEQQLATEKIRQSEANLALAQRVAHMGSWEVDLTNREEREKHPPRWSDETFRIFGFQPGEIEVTHESFFHLLHPDERQLARATFIRQLRTGAPYSIDHRIIRPPMVRSGSCMCNPTPSAMPAGGW